MKIVLKTLIISLVVVIIGSANGDNSDYILCSPPFNVLGSLKQVSIQPVYMESYSNFCEKDMLLQKRYLSNWSTVSNIVLDSLDIDIMAASSLNGYKIDNAFDGNQETAWVEDDNGDGIGQWIAINIQAYLDTVYSTPFTIEKIAIIPGYLKSNTTWENNNRLKEATLLVYSPDAPPDSHSRYVMYQLHFSDTPAVQVFDLEGKIPVSNLMFKKCWLIIQDVYHGTRYRDTCISEIIFTGRCKP